MDGPDSLNGSGSADGSSNFLSVGTPSVGLMVGLLLMMDQAKPSGAVVLSTMDGSV